MQNIHHLLIEQEYDIATDVAIKNAISIADIISMYRDSKLLQQKVDAEDIADIITSIL